MKDSFASLDLGPHGFEVLFDATWIGRPSGVGVLSGETRRFAAIDPSRFGAWVTAWSGEDPGPDILRPALLDDPRVTLLAAGADTIVAGAVLVAAAGCIGVTNVFGPHRDHDAVWRGIVAWTELHAPGVTAVGYETGADLAAARRCGFAPLGPLRVWART